MDENARRHPLGALVRDTRRDRVGVVQAHLFGMVFLRPKGGGCEWEARPEDVAPADERDDFRARLADLNAASSGGVL
ncbi:hypothetical protein GXW83_26625 [Streptacidiphilus sp. PB12-B1b]|uniref:hypothetical protein n=1 Tax=Streptacidiphilus sp. PB12-B1b TaxID=2705012 RepID=UPI0015FA7C1B|nr:hypothetical protein [Streptacidiphilus sp. PB12-B1b]QMU78751.1 hypothetical protein GXW83_26625 [Streptacidiphilus sp. PB12-B1b]